MDSQKTTFSYLFYLRSDRKNKKGLFPIYLRITVNKEQISIPTNRYIKEPEWDKSKNLATPKASNSGEINDFINLLKKKVYDAQKKLLYEGKPVTVSGIKQLVLGDQNQSKTLIQTVIIHNEHFKTEVGKRYSNGTYKNYKTTLKFLKEFIPLYFKTADIPLYQLNNQFLAHYEHFLKNVKTCAHNGAMKHMQRIKRIANFAIINDWMEKDPFTKYQIQLDKSNRDFLSPVELKKMMEHSLLSEKLRNVRDIFVFACYTGLSFSDLIRLKKEHISVGLDGEKWIYIERQKTGIRSIIPLLPIALAIIQKHANHPKCLKNQILLPMMSNQKLNDYLKDIATECEINKNLSMHVARHTAATTVLLSNNVPIETVSKILGHTTIRTTQGYARVLENKIAFDVTKLREKLLFDEMNSKVTGE